MLLIVSVPFAGHLERLIENCASFDCELVILSWPNQRLSAFQQNQLKTWKYTELVVKTELRSSLPTDWLDGHGETELFQWVATHPRKTEIRAVFYDIFAFAGQRLAKQLGVRAVCSIPAFFGSATPGNQISDGAFLQGDGHVVWGEGAIPGMSCLTYPLPARPKPRVAVTEKPCILISMGTVVMGYLWDSNPTIGPFVTGLIQALLPLLKPFASSHDVFLATNGRDVGPLPGWLQTADRLPQVELLDRCALFITHGGGNSYHEARRANVPMLVVPFFGDQHSVARHCVTQGYGVSLPLPDGQIDPLWAGSNKTRTCSVRNLAHLVEQAIQLKPPRYNPVQPPVHALWTYLTQTIDLRDGDLLFGCNADRQAYVQSRKLEHDIPLFKYKPWKELECKTRSLPPVIDIYHDEILRKDKDKVDGDEFSLLVTMYTQWLRDRNALVPDAPDWVKMCCAGIDFFLHCRPHCRIHFIIGNLGPENHVTRMELVYLTQHHSNHFQRRVLVYHLNPQGVLIPMQRQGVPRYQLVLPPAPSKQYDAQFLADQGFDIYHIEYVCDAPGCTFKNGSMAGLLRFICLECSVPYDYCYDHAARQQCAWCPPPLEPWPPRRVVDKKASYQRFLNAAFHPRPRDHITRMLEYVHFGIESSDEDDDEDAKE